MALELPSPSVRAAKKNDARALAEFKCSTGSWFEEEVEKFIQNDLLSEHDWRQPHTDHRILVLELPSRGIVAVGAHERDFAKRKGETVVVTKLIVAAVSADCQGAVLVGEESIGERPMTLAVYLVEALNEDLAGRQGRSPYVYGVVARENLRSLRLCSRCGLTEELDADEPEYVRRVGTLAES